MRTTIYWRSLFDRVGIRYVTRSPNISAGEIGVKCPWCGASDPSEHLAVDEAGRGYVCRRNRAHRGKSPARLIAAIKRIPYEAAEGILGRSANTPAHSMAVMEGFKKYVEEGFTGTEPNPHRLKLWSEFKPLRQERGLAMVFWEYLRQERGFHPEEILWLRRFYDLHYAATGRYAYRVIVPIYNWKGELVNWVGRAVGKEQEPRYRALPEGEAEPPGNHLLGAPDLLHYGGVALVVVEGPFDAFRISAVGHRYGVYGTCLFGLNISPPQAELLRELHSVFEQVYLALDPGARLRAWGMLVRSGIRLPYLAVPSGVEDPGAMTRKQTQLWLAPLIERNLAYGEARAGRPPGRGHAQMDS